MPLLLQLDLGEAPGDLGRGLLQAFYCADPDCEQKCDGWVPFSRIHRVRIVAGTGALDETRNTDYPARSIVSWAALDDMPSAEDHEVLGLEATYDFKANTVSIRCPSVGLNAGAIPIDDLPVEEIADAASGDKLLGWPHWVQGPEYAQCPRCRNLMRYLFQIESRKNLPIMWGDLGVAHIFQCVSHPDVLTMAWACS